MPSAPPLHSPEVPEFLAAARAARGNAAYVRATNPYFNAYDVAFANGDSRADCRRAAMAAFCDRYGYDYPDFM